MPVFCLTVQLLVVGVVGAKERARLLKARVLRDSSEERACPLKALVLCDSSEAFAVVFYSRRQCAMST